MWYVDAGSGLVKRRFFSYRCSFKAMAIFMVTRIPPDYLLEAVMPVLDQLVEPGRLWSPCVLGG